jgi:integrase
MKFLRRRGPIYQFERPVPKDIQHIVGKKPWRESLRTDSEIEAEIKCRKRSVETDDIISSARNGTYREIVNSDIDHLAMRWSIDFQSINQERIASAVFPHVWEPLDKIGDEAEHPIIGTRDDLSKEVARWAHRNNIEISTGSADWEALVDACHDLYIVANPEITDDWRLVLDSVGTGTSFTDKKTNRLGVLPARATADPSHSLSLIFKRYLTESAPIAESTEQEFSVSVRRFTELFGDIDVNKITRQHAEQFRLDLLSLPARPSNKIRSLPFPKQVEWSRQNGPKTLQQSTVNKNLLAISLILKFAYSMTAVVTNRSWVNPFDGFIQKPRKTADKSVVPFTKDQIKLVFSELIYQMNSPENFWIPLVLFYTGARLDEISQMHTTDVVLEKITYFIVENLDDDDPELSKKVKSISSNRHIPLASELVDLGFLDYVKVISTLGHTHLFPNLTHKNNRKRGNKTSRAFIRAFRKFGSNNPETGLDTKKLVTHSLRHSFRTIGFRNADQELIKVVMGHLVEGVSIEVYGAEIYKMADILKDEVIDKIEFPKLNTAFLKKQSKQHLDQLINHSPINTSTNPSK